MWMDGFDTSNLLQPNNMRHGLFVSDYPATVDLVNTAGLCEPLRVKAAI